ncbi:paeninodin family lasso peptide [Bacillus aerolatus]|uniref:Paeninodin family lasso peptide n=1 Tax=Bacillus aerolatus TaxID=2653354 RepID=A0A6I1FNY7_9BACI|nr:paeninodin family lasso peptide [Bacillus aerolatus]KAB7708154.1 paeninodin family lasso peptide [Bacillus aerolatus]
MKKVWKKPELEVLNVGMTMAGPGNKTPDAVQPDPDAPLFDVVHYS